MSHKENISRRKKSDVDVFGFDYEGTKDKRNARNKGKFSYKDTELMRINYIKQKKDLQRQEQKKDPLTKFTERISKDE
jgi:hypothetical protein